LPLFPSIGKSITIGVDAEIEVEADALAPALE